jgi:hypothetical protein
MDSCFSFLCSKKLRVASSLLRLWSYAAYPAQLHLIDGSIKQAPLSIQSEEL